MTNLRKAAERLLEALEDGWVQRDDWVAFELRQQLAQPEQEPDPFKPDWDMLEPYHERIKELEIENERLRQALAQPEQEPVAYLNYDNTLTIIGTIPKSNTPIPLYLRSNREFVVLTDDEVDKLCMAFMGQLHKPSFARSIEAALRSKNDPTTN